MLFAIPTMTFSTKYNCCELSRDGCRAVARRGLGGAQHPYSNFSAPVLKEALSTPMQHPLSILCDCVITNKVAGSAKAERSFSTAKQLLTDHRRSMTHERLRNIVVLT